MKSNKTLLAGLISLFTSAAIVSHAQAEDVQSKRTLEEIIVTAQKRAESLQDVPIAVSAFSGDDLTKFGVSGTDTLQNVTPGLVINTTGSIGSPYLRGVGTRLSVSGLESSVATYVDGRYLSRASTSIFDLADIERVEVLKGPQGTLYGRNSSGGAIRIITKEVGDEFEGDVKVSAGNFGYYSLSGTMNVPMSDAFGARFTVLNTQRDGYINNLSPLGVQELDDQDFQAYRAKFNWEMSDSITSQLTLAYWEKDHMQGNANVDLSIPEFSRGLGAGGITGVDTDEAASEIKKKDNGDEFSAELRFDVAFDNFDVVSISVFSDMEQEISFDTDGTSARSSDAYIFENEEAFSQEIQLISNNEGNWNWILGAYYYDSKANFETTQDIGPFVVGISLQKADVTASAIFGQTTWDFNDRWSLTLGGRWSNEEKAIELLPSPHALFTSPQIPVPFSDTADWTEFTPKATLEYNLDNGMVYASYARGFKSGGYNYPASTGPLLDPEILDMIEFGAKMTFMDNSLRLNASLYYYDYQDLQVTRATSAAAVGVLTVTENAANAEILGLDLDITWLVSENLTAYIGLNLLDAEYSDYDASAKVYNAVVSGDGTSRGLADVFFDASGESMLRAPDWSAFVSLEYVVQLDDATMPLVVTYSYKDEYDFDFIAHPTSDVLRQDAYGLLSARLSFVPGDEKWEVALWGNNLADEEYFDDLVGNRQGFHGAFGDPRTYGVDFTFNF